MSRENPVLRLHVEGLRWMGDEWASGGLARLWFRRRSRLRKLAAMRAAAEWN